MAPHFAHRLHRPGWAGGWARLWLRVVLLLGGCCTATALIAQALPLRYYQHSDGLLNVVVTALAQDPQGRWWVGTENGVFRLEGLQLTPIDWPVQGGGDRHITALSAGPDGAMWIGSRAALRVWRQGELRVVRVGDQPLAVSDGLGLAQAGDGWVLVASEGQLRMVRARPGAPVEEQALPPVPEPGGDVVSVLRVSAQEWWTSCGPALCRWRQGQVSRWGPEQGVPVARWAGLLRQKDGSLWARSDRQLRVLLPGATRFEDWTPPALAGSTVHVFLPMVEDDQGRVLLHTEEGLLRWEAGQWHAFNSAQGLRVGGGVQAMGFDADGDLWFGTAGHGLAHWRGYRDWRNWTAAQGLPDDEVWSFLEDAPGRMWLGTGHGAVLLDSRSGQVLPTPAGSRHQIGSFVRDATGQLWAASFSGQIQRLQPRDGPREAARTGRPAAWQEVARGLPLIFGLLALPEGPVLAVTQGGLFVVEDAQGRQPRVHRDAAAEQMLGRKMAIRAICQDPSGAVWLATDKGLLRRSPQGELQGPEVSALPTMALETLACSRRGGLWLTLTDGSVWQVREDTSSAAPTWVAQRHDSPTLGRRRVVSLLEDRRGLVWMGTDDGVVVRTADGWRRFDQSNGLVWSDASGYALHEDAQGAIWVGTSGGASQILRPAALFELPPLRLALDEVSRGSQRWPADATVVASWSAEPLLITWRLPGYSNRDAHQVYYRLGGEGQPWLQASPQGVRFDALPAGVHELEAFVLNLDRDQRSPAVRLRLDIQPPWWRSPLAWLGYIALGAALVGLAHRWRLRALLHQQRLLEAQVRLRTQELERSRDEMRQLALSDALTGTMNRRAILEAAQRELDRTQRGERPLVLVLADIDHFKQVNDGRGHPAGDAVLRQVAERLRAAMRTYDLLGRYGGEEFLIVLPGLDGASAEALRRLQALRAAIADPAFDLDPGEPLRVTCSMGVAAAAVGEPLTLQALIALADAALYRAKALGRNRVELADRAPAAPSMF